MTRLSVALAGVTPDEWRWSVVSGALLVVLGLTDISLPGSANISGALAVAPLLASNGVRPKGVLVIGLTALAVAVGLAFADGSGPHASGIRFVVIIVATLGAGQAASLRIRREQRLVELATVAEATQRAIIRKPAAHVGTVAVATWYQSSTRAATVGGDCFEILETPFGTRAIIGDVKGHGMPSVRLAALVLGGFRALAYTEVDVVSVAHRLDNLTFRYAQDTDDRDIDGEEFVTAVLCQVNGPSLALANCGHPAPLLVTADGQFTWMEASQPTCPLGVGSLPVLDHFEVGPASRLLLYTDGLTEARDRSGNFFDLERAAPQLADGPLAQATAWLIDEVNSHAHGRVDDDVAVMLMQF